MNDWLLIFLVIAIVAVMPFFLICWNLSKVTYRLSCQITPAPPDIPDQDIKEILQPAIAELIALGFDALGYHQIQRPNINENSLDCGAILYHAQTQVYASIMPVLANDPPIKIGFSNCFADGGCFSTLNDQITNISSQPRPEVSICQRLGAIAIAKLWQSHQKKLQELCLTRQPLTLSLEAYVETVEQQAAIEIRRLIHTKEMVWVEPDRSYRMSWLLVSRIAWNLFPKMWKAIYIANKKK